MNTLLGFISDTFTIAYYEIVKIARAPMELFTRAIQPILWLLIFGQVFARVHMDVLGKQSYIAFITPGIMAQSVLFIAIFYGIAIIWERDLGILHKVLVSPCPRAAIVLGKGLSAGVRALTQVIVVLLLALLLRVNLNWSILAWIYVVIFIFLEAALFATFSAAIACIVKTRERFMGIGQVILMPLFFASNAIYPIAIMPNWLRTIAKWNPLTYEIDALRSLILTATPSAYGLTTDFLVLLGFLVVLVIIGGWLYPRVVQ